MCCCPYGGLLRVGLGWDSGWDCARGIAGFSHRESALPDPLIIRTVDQLAKRTKRNTKKKNRLLLLSLLAPCLEPAPAPPLHCTLCRKIHRDPIMYLEA